MSAIKRGWNENGKKQGLEKGATFPLGATASLNECCTGGVLKHLTNALSGLGRAFKVSNGTNLLGNSHTLLSRDWALAGLAELVNNLGIVSKILLAANKDGGQVLAEVKNFRNPFLLNVVERVGRVDGEADEDDVRIRV